VFEFVQHDLHKILVESKELTVFNILQLKYILRQILEGCAYLHKKEIIHRDIKAANILINNQGIVKLADFGLAREVRRQEPLTTRLVTRWYRAPEISLQEKYYSFQSDVWSVGCVFAEMVAREPLFNSRTDHEHFAVIIGQLEGQNAPLPKDEDWPKFSAMYDKVYSEEMPKPNLPEKLNRGGLQHFFDKIEKNPA